ncbi:MAG: hypothetical protein AAGC85_02445 [Bacteroidota bacterium]
MNLWWVYMARVEDVAPLPGMWIKALGSQNSVLPFWLHRSLISDSPSGQPTAGSVGAQPDSHIQIIPTSARSPKEIYVSKKGEAILLKKSSIYSKEYIYEPATVAEIALFCYSSLEGELSIPRVFLLIAGRRLQKKKTEY